uniref:hypothetical protein n=1 Tax=Methylobacterium sp. B34 TaxID=95563 RepID=UPI0005B29269|nr:hypothetical protein [Methylobacterium sp. B34]
MNIFTTIKSFFTRAEADAVAVEDVVKADIAKIVADAEAAQAVLRRYEGVVIRDVTTQALVHVATARVEAAVAAVVTAVDVAEVDAIKLLTPPVVKPPVVKPPPVAPSSTPEAK